MSVMDGDSSRRISNALGSETRVALPALIDSPRCHAFDNNGQNALASREANGLRDDLSGARFSESLIMFSYVDRPPGPAEPIFDRLG